ncbi:hypothetical protein AB0J82_01635 [Asanoa sp. NPDC049518]|uniref:hypothetical protein n=1 Tax=unclassified Asanoa TaxID=2685164 RepID=UPI00342A7B6C
MRPDWRDTVRVATDVALLGLLMVATSLPVVTTGAAFATASYAVHTFLTDDRWPAPRACWHVFRRALLPGALATAVVLTAAWLVTVDLTAVSTGRVPGGAVVAGLTGVIAAAACGYAALALVALGRGLSVAAANAHADPSANAHSSPAAPAGAWRWAAKAAASARPATVGAAAGVIGLAGLLAVLVHPILAACLVGYALYALHVVTRRLTPNAATQATP